MAGRIIHLNGMVSCLFANYNRIVALMAQLSACISFSFNLTFIYGKWFVFMFVFDAKFHPSLQFEIIQIPEKFVFENKI